ncbi:MAG: hypothetical protein ABI663_05615 [Chryseolinea sp.]
MKLAYTILILSFFHSITSTAQEKNITIGSGGGFAGTSTVYKITSSGKVFKGKGIGEIKYTECGKIKKAHALKYIQSVSEQTQSNEQFNHPGNLYYFVGYAENSKDHKVTWGDVGHPVPESIQKLYQEINSAISSLRFKPIK